MAKGNKRSPDLRKIRTTRVYRVQDIANALDREARTVRTWIKAGLPTLDDRGTALVDGAALKSWLKERNASRKQKCLPDEFYCCKCTKPRNARLGSVSFHARNAKTITIKALCVHCGTRMNKAAASADIAEIQVQLQPHMPRLTGCDETSVNKQHSAPIQSRFEFDGGEGQEPTELARPTPRNLH